MQQAEDAGEMIADIEIHSQFKYQTALVTESNEEPVDKTALRRRLVLDVSYQKMTIVRLLLQTAPWARSSSLVNQNRPTD